MAIPTNRLGLIKQGGDEYIDRDLIDQDYDRLDEVAGIILVSPGSTPTAGQLYDGALWKEKGQFGKYYVAEKNVGGTYDHRLLGHSNQFAAAAYDNTRAPSANQTVPASTDTDMTNYGTPSATFGAGLTHYGSGVYPFATPNNGIYTVAVAYTQAAVATTLGFIRLVIETTAGTAFVTPIQSNFQGSNIASATWTGLAYAGGLRAKVTAYSNVATTGRVILHVTRHSFI